MDHKDTPTRTAVALHWDGDGAPRVTAKGRDHLAERIVAVAREHDVPIKEDRELTAVLANVELGDTIPEELYLAVAQVIAFAYKLTGKSPSQDGESGNVTRDS